MSVLTRVPITYEVRDGGTTHAPMVIAGFGGIEGRFVLDTGSEVHLLNEELVDQLGLAKQPGEEGTDHSGATMRSWSVGDVPMSLGDADLVLPDVVAIPAPPPFRAWGIRGILSPQHLHPTAMSVIDLTTDELLLVEGSDEQVAELLRARPATLRLLTLARDGAFSSVVVRAAIEGFDAIPTLLNTGGKGTEFSMAAVPGLAIGASERLGGGVSGADYAGGSVGPQTLVVENVRLPVPALHVRPQMHDPQGLVGTDVLRGTILACAADLRRPVYWSV
ncbi:MAG: aspartyl protease family protein [Candidatus Limnocylindrales bacterium]